MSIAKNKDMKHKIKKALQSLEELKGMNIKVIEEGETIVVVMSHPDPPGTPPPDPDED